MRETKRKRADSDHKYNQSDKGKARMKRYNESEKGRARRRRFNHSIRGRDCYIRYRLSGKEARTKLKYRCEHIPITTEKIWKIILTGY